MVSRVVATGLFWAILALFARAQDPRFSQFFASPWNLNPALTGAFEGRWRVVANYRDQWSSLLSPVPFRTYSTAADMRWNVGPYDHAALGIGLLHDEAGQARFSQNKALLGGAFLKQISGGPHRPTQVLSAGAQVGFGQNSVDWGRLWFSRQFDPNKEAPDFNAPNGEPNAGGNSDVYLDFNAGLLWYVVSNRNDGFWTMGIAWHHLNRPNVALLAENPTERLYLRWTMHAGGLIPLSDQLGLLPGVLVMRQGPAFEATAGAGIRYANNDRNEIALRTGAWLRTVNRLHQGLQTDALVAVVMLELERWMLGLSYDLTTSSLARANNSRGAFELSLTYYHPAVRRSRVVCPRF